MPKYDIFYPPLPMDFQFGMFPKRSLLTSHVNLPEAFWKNSQHFASLDSMNITFTMTRPAMVRSRSNQVFQMPPP